MASESRNMHCGNCSRRSRSNNAVKYCTDCEDALCIDCLDVHGNIKLCASHHVIDVEAVDGKVFNISKSCKIHPDMVLEYFCSDHDTLCCRSCMASDHRSCDKLLPIEVAAKGVKSSTMYEEIGNDVTTLTSAVKEFEDQKNKIVLNLNDSKIYVQDSVKKMKTQLQTRIQEIEAALMSEIDKLHEDLSKESADDIGKIRDHRKNVQNISEQFNSISKHGSESQVFMMIHNIKEQLNCHVNGFQQLVSSQKNVSLSFNESKLLSVMSMVSSFGTVEIKESSLNIDCKPLKIHQAQIVQQQRKMPTQFKLDAKFKVDSAQISGIGVTKDNRLFLCNFTGSNLYVVSVKGQQFATIQMDGPQWGIAMEEEANSAWVTIPDKHSVQAVDVVTMKKKGQLIKSPGRCNGIALIDDQIAVGSYGKIYIMSKTGEIKKTLDVGGSEVHSISVGQKNQLYYAQGIIEKSTLKSVGLDGLVTSISAENVNYLVGVKLDRIGNAYLLECATAHFKIYSFEDKSIRTILTKNEGLNNPYGFAFSNDFSKLCISNCNTKEILVFQCT